MAGQAPAFAMLSRTVLENCQRAEPSQQNRWRARRHFPQGRSGRAERDETAPKTPGGVPAGTPGGGVNQARAPPQIPPEQPPCTPRPPPRGRLSPPAAPPLNCDKSLVLTGRYDEYAGKLL